MGTQNMPRSGGPRACEGKSEFVLMSSHCSRFLVEQTATVFFSFLFDQSGQQPRAILVLAVKSDKPSTCDPISSTLRLLSLDYFLSTTFFDPLTHHTTSSLQQPSFLNSWGWIASAIEREDGPCGPLPYHGSYSTKDLTSVTLISAL